MFRKEETFQKTPIGTLPDDWEPVKLGELGELQYGYTTSAVKEDNGTKFLRITDINEDGSINWKEVPYCNINPEEFSKYALQNGDILFARIGATAGKTAIVRENIKGIFASYLIRLKVQKQDVFPEFVFYETQSETYWSQARRQREGQLKKGINATMLSDFLLPLPPFKEQRAIVGVLGVVDSAIEYTNRVIAKTERLKRGLMQQLLTQGIGHTETKQTPIGTIPKEWQVVKLKDAVKIDQESRDPSREMPNKTFTYIDIESIEGGTGKIRSPKIILGKDAPSRARRVVHENDVIMSTVRPYLKAFAIVPKEYDDVICSTGFAVLTSGNSVLPRFLLNVLFSNQTINQCNKMMVGGQYPALNQSQVSEIEISLPPLHEQQHISGILSTVDDKLELERAEKIRFERIKRGLMDLLLTGKIRIKVD